MKRFHMVLLLPGALLIVTACSVVTLGSGDVITETRQVSNFERIVLLGQGIVVVSQDGTESLSIESNANILELVESEVVNGTLELGLEEGVNIISNARLIFYVSVDNLGGLSTVGSGEIESERIEADRLETAVSGSGGVQIADLTVGEVVARIGGSGEINLAGEAKAQNISISGSGKYLAGDLCSGLVMVSISGSGDATICATETLASSIIGGGSVGYYGQPSISSSVDGSGQIKYLGEK